MNSMIESLSFNDDYSRFIVATCNGFLVYETDPYLYKFSRHEFEGGLKIAKVFGSTGIISFVGTGKHEERPENVAFLWDQREEQIITSMQCTEEIKMIIPQLPLLAVITDKLVFMFQFGDETVQMPKHEIDQGTYECVLLKYLKGKVMLIYPSSKNLGTVIIQKYKANKNGKFEEFNVLKIPAHQNKIRKLATNSTGTLLLTCSVCGTLIKIFDTDTGNKIQELRRGLDTAQILDCCFSPKSDFITVVSSKGTLHIYSLNDVKKDRPENKKSSFSFISNVLPSYFSSEWSFAKTTLDPEWVEAGLIVTFGRDQSIIVIVKNGKYIRYHFNTINQSIEKDKEDRWCDI